MKWSTAAHSSASASSTCE